MIRIRSVMRAIILNILASEIYYYYFTYNKSILYLLGHREISIYRNMLFPLTKIWILRYAIIKW